MKSANEFIERNINTIKENGKRKVIFGTSYIQRLCKIGYVQACDTIKSALRQGVIHQNPESEREFFIK